MENTGRRTLREIVEGTSSGNPEQSQGYSQSQSYTPKKKGKTEVGKALSVGLKSTVQAFTGLKKLADDSFADSSQQTSLTDLIFGKEYAKRSKEKAALNWASRGVAVESRIAKRQKSIDEIAQEMYTSKKSFKNAVQDADLKWLGLKAIEQVPQMAGMVGLGYLTGGTGAFAFGAGQATGSAYNRNLQYGGTDSDKRLKSIAEGLAVGAIDKIGISRYLPDSAMTSFTQNILKSIPKGLKGATAEAITEMSQEIISNAFDKTYNQDRKLFDNALESFVLGGMLGGTFDTVFEATGKGVDYFRKESSGKEIVNTVTDLQTRVNEQQATGSIDPIMLNDLQTAKKALDVYEFVNKDTIASIQTDSFVSNINILPIEDNGKRMYQAEISLAPIDGIPLDPIKSDFFETEQEALDSIKELAPQEIVDSPQFQTITGDYDNTTSLEQEAKKYNSAEEFVKAQPTAYRGEGGSNVAQGKALLAEGKHFASDAEYPKGFGKVGEYVLKPNAKVLDLGDSTFAEISQKLGIPERIYISPKELSTIAKEKGYDVVKYTGEYKSTGKQFSHTVDLTGDSYITKSQLTDIWNKTNKKVTLPKSKDLSTELVQQAKKYKSAEEFVKAQGGVGDNIAKAMQKEFELETLTTELSKKANSFAGKGGLVTDTSPEYIQVKNELDKAMSEYRGFKKSELGKIVQQERRKLPLQVRMKMLKGDIKTKSQLEQIWKDVNEPQFKVAEEARKEIPLNKQEAIKFFEDITKRTGVEFAVDFVDNIYTGGKNKDLTPEQAYGMYFDGKISLSSRVTSFTKEHEVSHLVFNNIENIDVLRENGVTKEAIVNELRNEYGNLSITELDEKLAELTEQYMFDKTLNRKNDTKGALRKLLDFIWDTVSSFLGNKNNMSAIDKYFDIVFGDKKYKVTNKVVLQTNNKSARYYVKPTQYKESLAKFQVDTKQALDGKKNVLKIITEDTVKKFNKEKDDKDKVNLDVMLSKVRGIQSDKDIIPYLNELRQLELQRKLDTTSNAETVKKTTLLKELKTIYSFNDTIIRDIKKELEITDSLNKLSVSKLTDILQEADKRYNFAVSNGYMSLPSAKNVEPMALVPKVTTGKNLESRKTIKRTGRVLGKRVPGPVRELFTSYDFERTNMYNEYIDKFNDYTETIRRVNSFKPNAEQIMLIESKFGKTPNGKVDVGGLLSSLLKNYGYPGSGVNNKYASYIKDLGDIIGIDIITQVKNTKTIFNEALSKMLSVGIDVNNFEDYIPRTKKKGVSDDDFRTRVIESLQKKYFKKFNVDNISNLTDIQRTQLERQINNVLKSFDSDVKSTGIKRFEQSRQLGEITDSSVMDLFEDPIDAIESYVSMFTTAYSRKKFFGVETDSLNLDSEENINKLITSLVDRKLISESEFSEVIDVYKAYFHKDDSTTLELAMRKAIYMKALNNIMSGLTQFLEVLTVPVSGKGFRVWSKNDIKLFAKDVGIELDTIKRQEGFFDDDKVSDILLFAVKYGDMPGLILSLNNNAKFILGEVKKIANGKKADPEIERLLTDIWGDNAPAVVSRLANYNWNSVEQAPIELRRMVRSYTENFRVLSRLSKTEYSIKHPTWFALKNFTLLSINIMYDRAFKPMKIGIQNRDANMFAKGLGNAVAWWSAYSLAIYLKSTLDDLITGEESDEKEKIISSLVGFLGLNSYVLQNAGREGVGSVLSSTITPAGIGIVSGVFNNMSKSIKKNKKGETDPKSIKDLPIIGRQLYYWLQ